MQPMRTRVDSSSSGKSVRNVYVSEKLRCRSNLLRCWSDVELSLTDIDFALLVGLDLLWLVVVTGGSVMDSCLVTAGRMLRRLSVSDRESPLDFLGSASDFPAKWILWFRIQIAPTFIPCFWWMKWKLLYCLFSQQTFPVPRLFDFCCYSGIHENKASKG